MKLLAYLGTTVLCIAALSLTSCKEDETAPDITVTGEKHVIHAKGAVYSDAGATASDNKDESVYVIHDINMVDDPKNPDVDVVGDYTITYTAQDRAGNTSTATRTVSVTHTMWQLSAHQYNVTDICLTDTTLDTMYVSTVVVDTDYVFRTSFSNLMGFLYGATYMDPVGNHITIPTQHPDSANSPLSIEGSGTISETAGVITIDFNYTFKDASGVYYSIPLQRHATFVSF